MNKMYNLPMPPTSDVLKTPANVLMAATELDYMLMTPLKPTTTMRTQVDRPKRRPVWNILG